MKHQSRYATEVAAARTSVAGATTNPPLAAMNPAQAASHVHNASVRAAGAIRERACAAAWASFGSTDEPAYWLACDAADAAYSAVVDATEAAWQEIVAAQRER